MTFGPLTAFLGGAAVFVATFDATDALLRKLVSKSTSEEERSARDAHNRQAMLNRVRDFWVKGVLESSLHEEARIELGLEEHRDAVAERPWDVILQTPDRPDCKLPPGSKISDVFERVGRSLLILGEPGAGKTTTLLELAREMIDRAEKDPSEKIPVVFNLSSWTDPKQTLNEWMTEEMRDNYRIQKKIAETWIENDSILPLLDGLDEVANERKAGCVDVINGYLDGHSAQAVICCRKEEYEALDDKLKLQSAILLQSLTPEQIDGYLKRLSPDLDPLREALLKDRELQEFAKTPLILSIMTLAVRGMSIEELQSLGSIEDRRRHLFKTYVDHMFKRTTRIDPELYPKEKTIRWLSWLARKMSENSQTVFLIERIQPNWLETSNQKKLYSGINFLIFFLFFGSVYWLLGWIYISLDFSFISGIFFGIIFGLIAVPGETIETVESFKWSLKALLHGPILGFVGGIVIGVIYGLILWEFDYALFYGIQVGLLAFGSITKRTIIAEMEMRTLPNQGIRQSAKNGIIVGSFFMIVGLLIFGSIFGWVVGLSQAVFLGSIFGMVFGGNSVIHHYTLRFTLRCKNLFPKNLVAFLDYATDRIFLRKVGGGYVFVHRMLMEYFADLEPGPEER
jgi:membrane protein CcdC involved in cytochrome C biogenesis